MNAARITPFERTGSAPLGAVAAPLVAPLESLPSAFADRASGERWLDGTLRWMAERLDADRAELFETGAQTGELRHARSWPPGPSDRRLALERRGTAPWIVERIRAGEIVSFGDPSSLPEGTGTDEFSRAGVVSAIVIPLRADGAVVGAVAVTTERPGTWEMRGVGKVHEVARGVAAVVGFVAARKAAEVSSAETERLRIRIEGNAARPAEERDGSHPEIVGRSRAIRRVLEQIDQVAPTNASVLLLGETGTGKELVAHAIHLASDRHGRTMVKVNCAALPATLVEAELFGREKGAYTGALSRQAGRFELADGSTIFLDEIGELAPEIQVKLLRVLQEGEFERIGSTKTQRVNVRVVAATNRNLAKMVREGKFREDLYYRLNVFPIRVPPLRERREDISLLVWSFVKELSRSLGHPVERIAANALEQLEKRFWAGNVRELRNVVERSMILHRGATLDVEMPEVEANDAESPGMTLEEIERRHIRSVLEMSSWRVRGKNGAAEILGLKPTTLESRLEKLGIQRPA